MALPEGDLILLREKLIACHRTIAHYMGLVADDGLSLDLTERIGFHLYRLKEINDKLYSHWSDKSIPDGTEKYVFPKEK